MQAQQPWYEAPLEAEEEKKVGALAAAVAAVVNVRHCLAAFFLRLRGSFPLRQLHRWCKRSFNSNALQQPTPRDRPLPCRCGIVPTRSPRTCSTAGVGCAARLLHAWHLHPLPACAVLEREEGDQGGCCWSGLHPNVKAPHAAVPLVESTAVGQPQRIRPKKS